MERQPPDHTLGNPEENELPKTPGERMLALMGYEHLGDRPTGHFYKEGENAGQPILAKDFHIASGPHIEWIVTHLESLPENHPERVAGIEAAKQKFMEMMPNIEE